LGETGFSVTLVNRYPVSDLSTTGGGPVLQLALIPFLVLSVTLLIRAELRQERRQIYLIKPLSTLLVIAIAALAFGTAGNRTGYTVGVLVGLALSLGGDLALMFASPRAFRIGLVLFLLAHVAYTVAFTLYTGFRAADLIPATVLLVIAVVGYRYLAPGLGAMRVPVILYIAVICVMVARALAAFAGGVFSTTQAWLIAAGAILFWISDLILAVNRFRHPFRYNRISLAFYYGGQLLIALSPSFFA